MMKFGFDRLPKYLRKPATDPDVKNLISREPSSIVRLAHTGYASFPNEGVTVMFKEAPWVLPQSEIKDANALYIDAFHFHREGHENNHQYAGSFPGKVSFSDSTADIINKLGEPKRRGGGGISVVLKKAIPFWLKYATGDGAFLHFQFDDLGLLEMVTLHVESHYTFTE